MSATIRPTANQKHILRLVLKALNAQGFFFRYGFDVSRREMFVEVCLSHRQVEPDELIAVLKVHGKGDKLTFAEVLEINRAKLTFEFRGGQGYVGYGTTAIRF